MTAPGRRDLSVDTARGVAIVLIVVGHVAAGVRGAGIAPPGGFWGAALPALYLVHICVFAFLAGLFIRHGVTKYGPGRFLLRRVLLFTWLYVLWMLIQRGLRVLAGSTGNTSARPLDLLVLWVPEGQLWFFPWLLAATILVVLIDPWRAAWRRTLLLAITGAIGLASWGWEPSGAVIQGLALTPVLAVGAVIGDRGFSTLAGARPTVLALIGVLGAGVYLFVVMRGSFATPTSASLDRSPSALSEGVLGTVSGTLALLTGCIMVARHRRLAAPWVGVGRRSMEIFLAHITCAVAVRVLLSMLDLRDPGTHIALGTIAGVGGPLLLWHLARATGQDWIFDLPRAVRRRLAGGDIAHEARGIRSS